jgi:dTDP-4-dehydrorhamnose reductase
MTRILVTGASGFVGQNLARYFIEKGYQVVVSYHNTALPSDLISAASSVKLDIRDSIAVKRQLTTARFEVVIHAAGDKNVRHCEAHPDEAYETNVIGVTNVARACREIDARLVYISTDLIFAGTDGRYKETDRPAPLLVYSKTKLDGEKVMQELDDAIICRSGGLYGKSSPLLRWLTCELLSGRPVECFTDVFNTPTFVWNLAEMIESILARNLQGIFHTVGPERANRFEFFRAYAREFELDANLLLPSEAGPRREELLLQADASLASESTQAQLGIPFDGVVHGLKRLKSMGGV